ncbi:MAG: hypothetical protein GXY40_00305 [Syntrophomonadaceae bacterium]|jgi:hypothetical protein|nr:hypothetical protein [Syntrophomonadaceae bacterium]
MAIVKTTVGIPDKIYNLAEDMVNKLGISRSQLYSRALEAYVQNYLDREMADMLDQAFSEEPLKEDIDLQIAFKKQFDSRLESENETW